MPRKRNEEDSNYRLAHSQFPEAGKYVRQLLGYGTDYQYSNRDAGGRTGINYVTVATMANGARPEEFSIIKFCVGMGGNFNRLFRLYGMKPLKFTAYELAQHDLVPEGCKIVDKKTGADIVDPDAMLREVAVQHAREVFPEAEGDDLQDLAERTFGRMKAALEAADAQGDVKEDMPVPEEPDNPVRDNTGKKDNGFD